MTIKVIGAGFGRTGTMSLKGALELLGFGSCYHMVDVFQKPEHVELWEAAARGEQIDWNTLFEGYQSTTDWPGTYFYKQFMELYPDAKVVLTTRDPERWYDSVDETIYKVINTPVDNPQPWRALHNNIMWEGTFNGQFSDKAHAIDVYKKHVDDVIATVPKNRLLSFDIADGWEPLCDFLDVAVPDHDFPHLNDRDAFKQVAQRLNQ